MKLCNLVDIIDNSLECVVLKVKDDARLDLIKLGYFTGDEDIIRLTKGENHICTVFHKDGKNYSWDWGKSGYTIVSEEMSKKGKLIEQCITEDFDIYIGDNYDNLKNSLYIRSLDDVKDAQHFLQFMYWNKNDANVCVHKDGDIYKHFKSIDLAKEHFNNLGFVLTKEGKYIAETGCIVEEYSADKTKDMSCEM